MLVDSGLDPKAAEDPGQAFGRVSALAFRGLRLDPAGTLREQIAARGVDPAAIRTVLMTHLHVDHASGLKQFPGTTVVVARREWEAAHERGAWSGYHLPQLEAGVGYRTLEFGGPHAGFTRSADLFGDGSVIALSTPGHTLGHLSLLVRTRHGAVLIAGDAIYTLENLELGREPAKAEDRPAWRDSVAQLRAWRAANPHAPLIPGHDAVHWPTLSEVY